MKNTNMNTGAASLSDERERAAITACALMIKGICLTRPNAEWTGAIEDRIQFMLKQMQAGAAIAAGGAQETAAARDVLAERQRQVSAEGWTPEHDDEHDSEEMAVAAACYAESAAGFHHPATGVPHTWPWTNRWWKPTTPRRDLVKAGALILAEIERLDRAAASNGEKKNG